MHHFHGFDSAGHEHMRGGELEKATGFVRGVRNGAAPWRLKVDGSRAVLDLVAVGVGYLL